LKTNYTNFEIIIIDNASTDASIQIIKSFSMSVRYVLNSKNLGFAAGMNSGFKVATGNYIVTLNNDMTVEPDWLNRPVQIFNDNNEIGIICCRQMQSQNPGVIDGLYHQINSDLTITPVGAGKTFDHLNPNHSKEGYILSANGGSAIFHKNVIEQTGGFDEIFFAYLEEVDLCFRAFLNGWKIFYCPSSVVYHLGSASFSKINHMKYYYREKNRLLFFYKNFPTSLLISRLPLLLLWELRTFRVFLFKCKKPLLYFKLKIEAIVTLKIYREIRKRNAILLKKNTSLFNIFLKKPIIHHLEL
jgi:GT2 family glycosyltransferase